MFDLNSLYESTQPTDDENCDSMSLNRMLKHTEYIEAHQLSKSVSNVIVDDPNDNIMSFFSSKLPRPFFQLGKIPPSHL